MRKYLWYFLSLFIVVTGFYFFWSWAQLPEGHRYIYPIDDTYIHLALARNFADYGTWSVNTSGFDSASSSVLYTLLLTFFIKVFGDWEYYPLLINTVFGFLTIYAVYRYFKDFYGKAEMKWAIALLLPFTLLYMMVLLGMEHTIHMFLTVLAVYFIHKNVDSDFRKKDFLMLLLITFFISVIRFESMFFTASLTFTLFLRKNFRKGIAVLLTGFVPIIVFGMISVNQGGFFFPNSVMIKGSYPEGNHFLQNIWQIIKEGLLLNSSFYKCLFFPFLLLLMYLIQKYKGRNIGDLFKNETLIITIVSVGILQSLFAFMKYRYENYVMISVLLLIIPVISDFFKNMKNKIFRFNFSGVIMTGSIIAVILVSVYRFGYHHFYLKLNSKGINEQQIEMSRFLGKYYKGEKVLANDIGAISYFSHVQLLDMVGLGSTDIAKMKVANKHNTREEYIVNNKKYIREYTSKNHYKIAVIYPEWFPGNPPSEWIPVASWTIPEKYGPAIQQVVFYAIDPSEAQVLRKNLSDFDIDPNVKQWFYILK